MSAAGNLATLARDAARAVPGRPALISADAVLDWAGFAARLARLAAALHGLGLRPGDRVAIHAGMTPVAVEMLGAVAWAGLVAVPLNVRLSAAEQQAICARADVAAVLVEAERPPAGLAPAGATAVTVAQLQAAAAPLAPAPLAEPSESALAALIFTSGTTAAPKGVMLTNADLALHGAAVRRWLGYCGRDLVLQSQPLFHVAGINQLHAVAMAQAALGFAAGPGVAPMLGAVHALGATAIGLVPTTLALLLDEVAAGARPESLRNIVYGAAPITPELMARARRLLPGVRFTQFYGQTEAGPVTALLPADHASADPARLRSCGRPRPGLEIRIVAHTGREPAPGEVGEVQLRGAGLTRGYWRDPAQSAALRDGGWLRTGDLGFCDAAGYLTIVDRLKDMIVTGGENVYAAEVEAVLAAHPGVRAVAVFGRPDPHWGEAVHAVVVPATDTVTAAMLIAHCRGHIAGYKIPRQIELRRQPLPLNAVGKVDKKALRAELPAG